MKLNLFNATKKEKDYSLPVDFLYLQQSLQEFLPFEDISDMMIRLPGDLYRAVVEVKSTNYYLKTQQEQETLEAQFRNALASWDFSFAFYTQTRTIDAEDIVNKLQDDVDKLTTRELKSYGAQYVREIERLTKARNGNLIKHNYIIVACNDAAQIATNKTREDKDSYAFDKLNLNTKKVYEALAPMGLTCHTLTNEELLELLFVAFNKHSMLKANDILSFISNITTGKSEWDVDKVDILLDGLVSQLHTMLLTSHDMNSLEIEKAQAIIKEIEGIRTRNHGNGSELFVL